MHDSIIFVFGFLTFSLLSGGLVFTILELRKMGNRDEVESGPRSKPKRVRTTL
jgi:hypothetical protein